MSTQLIPTIPHTLAAQLIRLTEPQPRVGVLYHKCFSQLEKQTKPSHCHCDHVDYEAAIASVESGQADWLVSDRAGKPYKSKQVIVARLTREEARLHELQRVQNRGRELAELEEIQSAAKFKNIDTRHLASLRKTLVSAVVSSKIEQKYIDTPDCELRLMLRDPESFRESFGQATYRTVLCVAARYWEALLSYWHLPNPDKTPMFMSGGGKKIHTGDYNVEQIDAHQNTLKDEFGGKAVRPGGADSQRDLMDDAWDKAVAMADYTDRIQKTADQFDAELNKSYEESPLH
jgi:hypothetical protein